MVISKATAFGLITLALAAVGYAAESGAERKLFYVIYKEMVETNTTHSAGDTTEAARKVQKRLLDAGFSPGDVQLFEPFPKKGNLVVRFKGTGAKEPILLLAHWT